MIKTGQLRVRGFNTLDDTGLPADATVGPVGTLLLNGAANGATVTIGHPGTGRYTWSVTMPTLVAGDCVDMRIAATVGGIATEGIVWQDANDLNDAAAAPTAAAVADEVRVEIATELALLDVAVSTRATPADIPAMILPQAVRDAMKLAPTALPADAAGSVDTHLDTILACTCGSGSVVFIYTLTDSVSGLPIPNALVWVTTDLAGLNPIAQGYTNALGRVQFMLNPGPAHIWRQHASYTFSPQPDTETVT